uniref:Histone-lysine N-methyltransferase n=2 Tax=Graphocephala atropunctata TaxID=36148 RepID=A0A1B6KAF0_9HEMI
MYERRPSSSSNSANLSFSTPVKIKSEPEDSPCSPNISRYGRSHKPKLQEDFVSTDKKVSAYLKLSPGNQIQYFNMYKEVKKKPSPKKSEGKSNPNTPRRGRPPKTSPKSGNSNEDVAKIVIKTEPQDPCIPADGCEWMVGDLAWARVGGHPFWPCVIALDPLQKIYTKIVRKGRNMISQRWLHVQFFGDNGRRSWLNTTAIMAYNGREAFIQLGDTILAGMRKKEPKQTSAFVIKPAVVQVWEKAVQEAEDLIQASREDRISFFLAQFPPMPLPMLTKEQVLGQLESPPKKRGRKRKADQSPQEEEVKKKQIKLEEVKIEPEPEPEAVDPLLATPRTIADRKRRQALLMQLARSNQSANADIAGSPPPVPPTPTTKTEPDTPPTPKATQLKRNAETSAVTPVNKKKPKKQSVKKKTAPDFEVFCVKHLDRVSNDHPDLNEKEVTKYLQRMWNNMDDTKKASYKPRITNQQKEESESSEESPEEVEGSSEDAEEEVQSSKSSSPPPLAVATPKSAIAKRNNCKYLFSGAKAEKVCQICEKAGDTMRCRGPCQGYYHTDCLTNPPKPELPSTTRKSKKGRPRKSMDPARSPSSSDSCQSDGHVENGRVLEKEDKSRLSKDVDGTVNQDQTVDVQQLDVDSVDTVASPAGRPVEEVIEPEMKSSAKVRKGSKDSESGEESEGFRCKNCLEGNSLPCFICQGYIEKKTGDSKLYRCITAYCGKVYHEECLKLWPQTSWRSNGSGKGCDRGVLTCPQHTCHTCASDNPGVIKARYSNDKLVRCVRCPTTYHYGNYCLPAGSEILSNTQIICPQHYQPARKGVIHHVNAAWCFICASGGSLICCDLCPTSFHADCLNISTPPDGSYVCEDCLTGRFPLYGEIVWVKLGVYRWWPAKILYPALIPDNIHNLPHVRGEFAVKFFGSHDHYWINRGRVFLYQDGDTAGKGNYKKSSVDNMFEKAVKEASEAQRKYLEEKAARDAGTRPGMKPPNYVKLKTNKPVGNVRMLEMNVSSLTPCECDPHSKAPCAPESDCLNRILMVECNPLVCPAGEKCCNQLFEKRQYPPLQPYQSQTRGWGLKTLVDLKKGDFVIEYVGEMIDEEEYKKRLTHMHENNEENFYFLTIDKDRMLDAGPKGNVARFMNHSCQPNCETQKWTVNGDTRVGLFALCDIPANSELVFNYNLESIGSDKKPCMCGAPNCSGFIGVKANKNPDKEENKEKKTVKKKKAVVSKNHEAECFVCEEGGELLLCDGKQCTKGYHLSCLGKKQHPQGYWLCPWHQCNVCNKGRVQRCTFCVNSFCQEHSEGNIRLDPVKGLVCSKHDDEKAVDNTSSPNADQPKSKSSAAPSESTAMEVDIIDSGDNSTSTSSQNSTEIIAKEEPTNNNVVIKVSNVPERRSRRSRSYAAENNKSSSDKTVNGLVGKVIKRKDRPSSVDDKLIGSYDKTEPNPCPNEIDDEFSSSKDVTDLLQEIINTLPIKEEETVQREDDKLEQVKSEIEESFMGGENLKRVTEQLVQQENYDGICTENQNVKHESNENVKKQTEIDRVYDTSSSTIPEEDASPKTENNSEKSSKLILVDCIDTVHQNGETHNPKELDDQPKSTNLEDVDENNTLKTSENEHLSLNKSSKSINDQIDGLPVFDPKMDVEFDIKDKSKYLEKDHVTEEDSETVDKMHSEKISSVVESCSDKKVMKEGIEHVDDNISDSATENKEETLVPSKNLDIEEIVDDFELTYSESSSDKVYKSESSIEMKLTDYNGQVEKERTSERLEGLHDKHELSNCIEQSNVMEVA